MTETLTQSLRQWQEFYQMTGEVAATLTGLIFVVVSLGARLLNESLMAAVRVFVTPSVVYFTMVLIVSALLLIPTQTRQALEWELGIASITGLGYVLSLLNGLRERHRREPLDALGWLFHVAVPLAAMLSVALAAVGLGRGVPWALDAPALAVLLLIVTGVRNAWSATLRIALQVE
jgi:hypothetical protein